MGSNIIDNGNWDKEPGIQEKGERRKEEGARRKEGGWSTKVKWMGRWR